MNSLSKRACLFIICVVSLSSCVQGDLWDDLYEDNSELFCPSRKRAKQDINFVNQQPYYNWTCSFSVVAYISEGNMYDMYNTYIKLIDNYIKNNLYVITNKFPSITQYYTRDREYFCGLMFGTEKPSGRGLSNETMCDLLGYKEISVSSFSDAQAKYNEIRKNSKCPIIATGKNAEGQHCAILTGFKNSKKHGLQIQTSNPGGTASELISVQSLLIPSSIDL